MAPVMGDCVGLEGVAEPEDCVVESELEELRRRKGIMSPSASGK